MNIAVLAALCLVTACGPSRPAADDPLAGVTQFIPNPSFEEMDGELPRGWKTAIFRKAGEFRVDDVAREGERSVMISSETGGDLAWTAVVPVRPFACYRLSGWIKTEDVRSVDGGAGALLNIHGMSGRRTEAVTGTSDWTEVVFEFDAGANDALQINCLFGGWGRAAGAAWFDDIRLDLLEAREVKPEVRIDAGRRLHPISPYIYGELGTQYFLQDALGIAAGLHEYARQSDIIFMANYAQTVNGIGAIKTGKTEAAFDTTGLVLKLYRRHFGTIPVAVEGAPEPLDIMAAWTEDGRTFTVGIVNPTRTEQRLTLDLAGLKALKRARLFRIEGTDPKAKNVPGLPPEVEIRETPSAPFGGRLAVPPMSISLYLLEIAD